MDAGGHALRVTADPNRHETWHRAGGLRPQTGMVEMYHFQSMLNVCQHRPVYEIFRALPGT